MFRWLKRNRRPAVVVHVLHMQPTGVTPEEIGKVMAWGVARYAKQGMA